MDETPQSMPSDPSSGIQGGGQAYMPPPLAGEPSASEKQWATAIHLSGLTGLFMPFFNIFTPLILWLLKRPESAWLDAEGKRVINFQISYTLYIILAGLSIIVLIGFLLLPIIGIAYLIFLILGAVRASEGKSYHFPFTIKFIS